MKSTPLKAIRFIRAEVAERVEQLAEAMTLLREAAESIKANPLGAATDLGETTVVLLTLGDTCHALAKACQDAKAAIEKSARS